MRALVLSIALGAASGLAAADLSGDWIGVARVGGGRLGVYLSLRSSGDTFSGVISTSNEPGAAPIEAVRFENGKLHFAIVGGLERPTAYDLALSPAGLTGRVAMAGSAWKVALWPAGKTYPDSGRLTSGPLLIRRVRADYTTQAREAKVQGCVSLEIEIASDGRVTGSNIRVVRGLGMGLDQKAVDAVKRWRFMPAYRKGKPVAATADIELGFRLF